MAQQETVPYGAWPSPLDAATLAAGTVSLADVRVDGDDVYWTEGRPSEGGRQAIMRWRKGTVSEVTPSDFNARTRVHEYGGAPFCVHDGVVYASAFGDQRLYRLDGRRATPVTPEPDAPAALRYADGVVSPDGRWIVCVREDHTGGAAPRNEIVAVPTDGSGEVRRLAGDHDFASTPRLSPNGDLIAWLVWDHPNMPWDGTELWAGRFSDGTLSDARRITGGSDEAIVGPTFSPDGQLLFATDRTGFWNLARVDDTRMHTLTGVQADIGQPAWRFGETSFAPRRDGRIACLMVQEATSRLAVLEPEHSNLTPVDVPYTHMHEIHAHGDGVVMLAASPERDTAIVRVPADGPPQVLYDPDPGLVDPADISHPEALTIPTPDGEETHAFFYPPTNHAVAAPADERPPLVVITHGGPTGNTWPAFRASIQYWTTRGVAVADVNYRGSTGFGRAYRDALKGNWGVHDLTDVTAVARHLADTGRVDGRRLAIRGGSAGGYTTLCALTFDDTFAAGASHFGVADLEALARHTHKFESRYLDRMVGPLPEAADTYHERSPIHHTDRLATPMIILQGDEDRIVPPAQAEMMVDALREKGVPHAYLLFAGEQHGFRRAEHIVTALESELSFYGKILGFTPAGDITEVAIVGA